MAFSFEFLDNLRDTGANMATQDQEQGALRDALQGFSSSVRYAFLKSLHVGPLLGEDSETLGELSQLTFEELVALSLEAPHELEHLTASQERVLTTLLIALSEGDSPPVTEIPEDPKAAVGERESSATEAPINSVQCELDLRERLAQLRIHPNFSQVKDTQLKHFWDPSAPSSPFEESFTINQLMGMDLTVLSKKRSMTGARMLSMTHALDNALLALEGRFQRAVEKPLRRERPPVHATHEDHPWRADLEGLRPVEAALVESFISGASASSEESPHLEQALLSLPTVVTAQEFALIASGAPLSVACFKRLSKWWAGISHVSEARSVQAALASPGVHTSRLRDMLSGGTASSVFYSVSAVVCARAAGAQEVCVASRACEGVWTTNPHLVTLILKEARISRRVSPADAIRAVCPNMDPILHSWLCTVSKEVVTPVRVSKKGRKGRC